MEKEINDYIIKRYERWLEYSSYHCARAGKTDEACDILNEVIADLLKKDKYRLMRMVKTNSKCGRYKELDIYVLRIVRLNIFSPTSPYQYRYQRGPIDENVDYRRLKIADETDEETDRPAEILEKFHKVEEAFNQLNLTAKAREIFQHRFFQDLPFSQWTGPEKKKELYDIYNLIIEMIKEKIHGACLF